ncbi:MAG: nucleotide exchange factor GrpE [Prevotellaceae bacterium]|jgi:molecular chaperone GrpE|nr:nucleotide exchange factor GrpE [Prevotellaceae bacterium]
MSESKEKKEKHECCSEEDGCQNSTNRQTADGQADESCACEKEAATKEGAAAAKSEEAPQALTPEEKFAEAQDKYLRLVAEFDNYRKRTARERMELIHSASEDTIKGLLSVVDDFERAVKAAEASQDVAALREGIELIYQKLMAYLETKGLKSIETPVGDSFDTDLHDAVTKFPAPDESHKNKIIDTVQKGYKLYDKVIRYAKVVVGE